MDSIVGKVMRPFAAVWRVIALTLVICATGGAWAVSATAYTGTLEPWDYTTVYAWGNESNATFHNGKVIPINADGTDGTAMMNWNYFCSTRTSNGYTDPAPALYFRDAQSVTSSNFDFFPLTLGGLYVDSLGENDAIYTFTGENTNRSTEFGYGTAATYFKFNKSLTVNRGGATSFIGTATVEVADGATFTAAKSDVQANVGDNSTLILTGGATGQLAVPGGLAVNGTLDISAATRPTISGNVTLSAGSTLVLPAGTAKNSTVSISVCSGTLAVGGAVNVKIGTDDAVSSDLVVSGGTITKILTARTYTASVSGATNFSAMSWAFGGEACDAVFSLLASAEVTVSAASTVTIDSATTMASLKLLGSADLTIATSSQLTLAALNLSEYTGSVTISGTSFTLANGGLTGAATFILDPGTGNTYTMSQSNTGYTGEAVVKSGTVKMGNATSFGDLVRASSIRVKGSATLDENLANAKSQSYSIDSNKVVLEEGAVLTSSTANLYNGDPDNKYPPISRLKLEGNAEIVANDADVSIAIPYNYSYMHLDLGAYTLVKTGTHDFFISYPEISGTGVLDIRSGSLTVYPAYYGERDATFVDGTLKLASGTEFGMINYNGNNSPNFTVKNLELNGSITRESENSVLTVTGYISGTGTTPMLTLANGATLKPQSTTGGLTVTESITLSGAINVDLSEVNLSSKADGTYFAILTAPAASAFDTTGIGLTRGANSTGWVLYSRETAESGKYELGVYLTPGVTWSGTSGTWTDTSFNGGSGNYTTGQQVVFSDNGATTDALAVTVDGAKNVSALDFTADNRNVTVSGDAITAGTVSKSGSGIATVNSALSVTTSIAVNDGVLILNPTAASVTDEWTASDNGTLVVYVDSGATTTISAAITAEKLIKRGAGTLDLTSLSALITPMVIDEGKVVGTTTPTADVTINPNGTFTLKDKAWANGEADCFRGTGTLELFASSKNYGHDVQGVNFSGIVKVMNENSKQNNFTGTAAMFTTPPEFVLDSDNTHLGGGYYDNNDDHPFEVKDLSGSGTFKSQWNSSANHRYTIKTQQTKDTIFTGYFSSSTYSSTRVMNLSVIGDDSGDINSLTISQAQNTSSTDSSQALSTLTVANNAKVVFPAGAGWGYGKVVVDEGGYLESTNANAVTSLTLNDGATLVFPTSSSLLSGITSVTFASGTVTTSFPGGVPPNGGMLINWASASLGAAPAGSFVFDNGLTYKEFDGAYYFLRTDTIGLYILKAVAVDSLASPSPTFYTTITAALAENDTVYLVGAPNETVLLSSGKTITNSMGIDVSNLTVNAPTAEYVSPIPAVNSNYSLANTTSAPVAYYWTGTGDSGGTKYWGTLGNWAIGSSSGAVATREPTSIDTVVFGDSAVVQKNNTKSVAGIQVDGEVTISGGNDLETSGSVTGSGTLTLSGVCLKNTASTAITVSPAVNFTNGSAIAGHDGSEHYPITFNGSVSIAGDFIFWDTSDHAFNGAVNIESGAILQVDDGLSIYIAGTTTINGNFSLTTRTGTLTFGNVVVAESSSLTVSSGAVVFGGNVSIGQGKTLSIPASGVTYSGATFVGSGRVSFAAIPASALTFGAWTGTVALPLCSTNIGFDLNYYGLSGSTVELAGMTSGWLKGVDPTAIRPNLKLTGDMLLSAMSDRVYTFQTISGNGSLLVSSTSPKSITIAKIAAGYTGTIGNTSGKSMTITAVDMAAVPAVGDRLLKVSGDNITISGVTVNGVATPLRWVRKTVDGIDGIYVISGTIFSVY